METQRNMNNQSRIDPTRQTAGAIYRDALIHGEKQVSIGDVNYEMKKSLVDDINDTIKEGTKQFEGRPFHITVYEKFDLQMKKALIRRLVKTKYRPYPEQNTMVFKVRPSSNEVFFCWDLPERHRMMNIVAVPDIFPKEVVQQIRDWENMRLENFGFMKNEEGNWTENPYYTRDKLVSENPTKDIQVSVM